MQASTSLTSCSFCHKSLSTPGHDCLTKIYSIINSAALKKDSANPFQEIDNIVFQGGGVRGISYIGALKEIEDENPGFLKNVKRFAGTSAGAVFSLFLGLNMSTSEIEKLMVKTDFTKLIDDGIILKVTIQLGLFPFGKSPENFRVRDIFLAVKRVYRPLLIELTSNPNPKTKEELKERIRNIYSYYGTKVSTLVNVGMVYYEDFFTGLITELLLSIFQPADPKEEENIEQILTTVVEDARAETRSERAKLAKLEKPAKPASLQAQSNYDDYDFFDPDDGNWIFKKLKEKEQPEIEISDESALKDYVIDYALAELLYFVFYSQTDASGAKRELGLFTGDKFKKDIIEKAIEDKFKSLEMSKNYKKDFTFAELAAFKDGKGKPLFKPFYVVAYNSSNFRSEVFSIEHTPNVVVADAVRASMSIPIFFKSVTIRENGEARKVYFNDGKGNEEVKYMDGSVLDPYPIWIFDDLKYLLDNIPGWTPKRRIAIQNPRTLGFRILSSSRIDIFEKPYYDEEETQRKRVATEQFRGTFGSMMRTGKNAIFEGTENEYVKYGDSARSVYIGDLGIRTTDFDLTEDQRGRLLKSGGDGVRDYMQRAKTNFVGEGEKYA